MQRSATPTRTTAVTEPPIVFVTTYIAANRLYRQHGAPQLINQNASHSHRMRMTRDFFYFQCAERTTTTIRQCLPPVILALEPHPAIHTARNPLTLSILYQSTPLAISLQAPLGKAPQSPSTTPLPPSRFIPPAPQARSASCHRATAHEDVRVQCRHNSPPVTLRI